MKGLFETSAKEHACSDGDAARCLAAGHPKAKPAPVSFGMRDRTSDGMVRKSASGKDS